MLTTFHKRNELIWIFILGCFGIFVQSSNTSSLSKSYPITTLINAKWGQTPLYLEIAEYMADENISLFWDYIKDITELETPLNEYDSESKQYLAVMNILQSRLSTLQLPLLKLIVSMHSLTPRIQTHFQIAEQTLRKRNCKTNVFVQIDSYIICSLNELHEKLRLSSKNIKITPEIYSFDHIYPGSENNSRVVVLFGDLGSEEFKSFHNYLSVEASTGNIQYIIRHYIRYKPKQKVRLSGYGVELYLKSTEYKSQDDAPKTDEEEINSSTAYETEVQGFDFKVLKTRFPTLSHSLDQLRHNLLQGNEEIAQLKAWEFQDLGLQATAKIADINEEEALKILQFTAHNFPMQARSLLNQKVSDALREEVKHNTEVFGRSLNIVPPDGALFINGIFFDADTIDLNSVVETMRSETRVLESLHDNKVHGPLATAMLTLDFSSSANNEFAIDIRDTAIMWVNDIEKDTQYRRWPASVMDLLRPTFPGMLRNIRKNMFNLVLVVDPIQPNDGRNILKLAESFIIHMAPVHLGLVFTSKHKNAENEADYNALICAYNYVTQKKDSRAALGFLTDVFATVDSFEPIKRKHIRNQLKKTFKSISDNSIEDILGEDSDYDYGQQLSTEFVERLGFSDIPQALLNGVPMQKSLLLSESDFEEAIFSEIIQQTSKFQKSVYRGDLTDSDDVIDYLMQQPHVMPRLNQRILGNGDSKFLDMSGMAHDDLSNIRELAQLSNRDMTATLMNNVKYFTGKHSGEKIGDMNLHFLTLWIIGNLEEPASQELLLNALRFVKTSSSVRLAFIPNAESVDISSKSNLNRLAWGASQALSSFEATNFVIKLLSNSTGNTIIPDMLKDILPSTELHIKMLRVYAQRVLQLQKSQRLIIGNGKTYGPLEPNENFSTDDFGLIDRFNSVHYGNKIRKVLQENINQSLDNMININSDTLFRLYTSLVPRESKSRFKIPEEIKTEHSSVKLIAKEPDMPRFDINAVIDPASRSAQRLAPILILLRQIFNSNMHIFLNPVAQHSDMPVKNFYRYVIDPEVKFQINGDLYDGPMAKFTGVPPTPLLTQNLQIPDNWLVEAVRSVYDLDNIRLDEIGGPVHSEFELEYLLLEGHCFDATSGAPPRGLQITLGTHEQPTLVDTIVMANLGYFQLKANPGVWELRLREGKSADIYNIIYVDGPNTIYQNNKTKVVVSSLRSHVIKFRVIKKPSMQSVDLLGDDSEQVQSGIWNSIANSFGAGTPTNNANIGEDTINIFSVASGHLYERLLRIMMLSVLKHTKSTVKFWFLKNYLSPQFTDFLPHMAREYGFRYELVQYKWPRWLHQQTEKQRTIWGYKILFLDVLFPLNVRKIIFVDADAIVRTDLKELYEMDLDGAPYAYTPFCDSRKEMEGFRFWKQGYWRSHLMGRRYHISALYVVDLKRFRKIAAGDRLRGQYQALSQDPNSLANLDQDLPNNMIHQVAIKSLPDEWLWCQTWCNDNTLKTAKVIDLCNNPMTKEAKLTAAQRIVPEWKDYDMEIKKLMGRVEDHENLNDHDFIPIKDASQFETKRIDSSKKATHANDEL